MVRYFNYSIPQNEVLTYCQKALTNLGYEIAYYDPIDYHLYTTKTTLRKGLRKAEYVIFIKVEDRIQVYIYAETRIFKRASEIGLLAGDLTETQAADNLSLRFQKAIFDPIVDEFEKYQFTFWDDIEENREDEREIIEMVKRKRDIALQKKQRIKEKELEHFRNEFEKYEIAIDKVRRTASDEVEHYIKTMDEFITDSLDYSKFDWSIIQISKITLSHDDMIKKTLQSIMKDYPNYFGKITLYWVVNPAGRVIDVEMTIDSSSEVPDDDIENELTNEVFRWFFPTKHKRNTFAQISRNIEFWGNYHNIKYKFFRPQIMQLLENYPLILTETIEDTFFNNKINSQIR